MQLHTLYSLADNCGHLLSIQRIADKRQQALIACLIKTVIPDFLRHKMADVVIAILILRLEVFVYHGMVSLWIIFKAIQVIGTTQERIDNGIHSPSRQPGMFLSECPLVCVVVVADDVCKRMEVLHTMSLA